MRQMKVKKQFGLAFNPTFSGDEAAVLAFMSVVDAIEEKGFEVVLPELGQRATITADTETSVVELEHVSEDEFTVRLVE